MVGKAEMAAGCTLINFFFFYWWSKILLYRNGIHEGGQCLGFMLKMYWKCT